MMERNYKREVMSLCNEENRTEYMGFVEVSGVSHKSPGQLTHFENYKSVYLSVYLFMKSSYQTIYASICPFIYLHTDLNI